MVALGSKKRVLPFCCPRSFEEVVDQGENGAFVYEGETCPFAYGPALLVATREMDDGAWKPAAVDEHVLAALASMAPLRVRMTEPGDATVQARRRSFKLLRSVLA